MFDYVIALLAPEFAHMQKIKINQMIADVSLVTHPHCEAPTNIMTSASDTAIGAVLQ